MMSRKLPNLVKHRDNDCAAAIVFVHGFTGHPEITWGHFPQYLTDDPRINGWDVFSLGYPATLSLENWGIWTTDLELATVADLLRSDAEYLLESAKTIAIIAHSMGGLVVQRALVDDPAFAARVSHVILFGTPSGGLAKAWWLRFWKRQIRNLAQDSDFICDLRTRWATQFGANPLFKFLAVAGDQDQFVQRSSSLEPFSPPQRAVVPGDHISIARPLEPAELSVQLVLNEIAGAAAPADLWSNARLALHSREFHDAVATLEPNKDKLDPAALVELALALESVGRQADAIQLLEEARGRGHTDAMGVLAGRLKRRWILDRVDDDARRARQLYADAFQQAEANGDHAQAFYQGINVAFMDLTFADNREQTMKMALNVLEHCAQAPPDKWRLATEGEAWLYLGRTDKAIEHYRQAIQMKPSLRELDSMHQQAVLIARHLGDAYAEDSLENIFRGEARRDAVAQTH